MKLLIREQTEVKRGQSATFAIRSLNRKVVLRKSAFRKGMVLVDGLKAAAGSGVLPPKACREFEASVVSHCYENVTLFGLFVVNPN
jgi:hypothetical protein